MSIWDAFGSFTLGPAALQQQKDREDKRKKLVADDRARREKIAARRAESAEFQKNVIDEYLAAPVNPTSDKPVPALRRNFLGSDDPNGKQPTMAANLQPSAVSSGSNQPQQKGFGTLKRF